MPLCRQTDPYHGMAWGRFTFLGRVRSWDGLLALVRVSVRVPPLDRGSSSTVIHSIFLTDRPGPKGTIEMGLPRLSPLWESARWHLARHDIGRCIHSLGRSLRRIQACLISCGHPRIATITYFF